MTMRERLARLGGWAFTHIPGLRLLWARTTQSVVEQQDVPWVPLRTPLPECRVAVITTGGVHLVDQVPFDMRDPHGDASYRIIAVGTPRSRLTITHNSYDHRDAEQDLNILFPIELLASLVDRGVLGSLADAYSFMGHIEGGHLATLTEQTAPEVAGLLKQQRVDAVLLTPA
jgi:D-proline reductase (dithiol) PrdB